MVFNLYEYGKELLKNDDNLEWIDKVTCWVREEDGYNIYIFQVIIDDERELEKIYETITASIAIYFQTSLDKAIEKWNIYLIFECKEKINWKLKQKVEQDKYSARKMVWDELGENEIGTKEYIDSHLFSLSFAEKIYKPQDKVALIEKIKEVDMDLYEILQKKSIDIMQKMAMYIGDDFNE